RVRMRSIRQQQVSVLLEGVGPLRVGVDANHSAPNRGGAIAQDAAKGEVGGGVRSGVLLRRVVVEVLATVSDVGARHAPAGAGPVQVGFHPELAVRGAKS